MYPLGFVDSVRHLQERLLGSQDSLASVCCGSSHSIAVSETGQVFAWGWGDLGELGLGDGQQQQEPTPVNQFMGPSPVRQRRSHAHPGDAFTLASQLEPISPLPQVIGIACGRNHSMLLTQQGNVFTWGAGYRGELGLGDFGAKRVRPTQVHSLRRRVTAISAGAHSSMVLVSGGAVYLWGSAATTVSRLSAQQHAQHSAESGSHVGARDRTKQEHSIVTPGGAGPAASIDEAAMPPPGLDFAHVDAINAMDGDELRAEMRERGLSTRGLKHVAAMRQKLLSSLENSTKMHRPGDASSPVMLRALAELTSSPVTSVKAGWHFGILLTQNNRVYTFGCEDQRVSTTSGIFMGSQWRPEPRLKRQHLCVDDVSESEHDSKNAEQTRKTPKIVNVFAGGSHAGALSADGRLWLWGCNTHGQLGHTNSGDSAVVESPQVVARGSLAPSDSGESPRIVSVGLGWRHSVVLDASDHVHTWGHCIAARAAAHIFAFRGEATLGLQGHHDAGALQLANVGSNNADAQEPQELPVIVQPGQVPLAIMCTSSPSMSATLVQFRQEPFDVRGGTTSTPGEYTSPFADKTAARDMNLRVAGEIMRNALPGVDGSPEGSKSLALVDNLDESSDSDDERSNNDYTNEILSNIDPVTLAGLSKEQLVAIMRVATNDHGDASPVDSRRSTSSSSTPRVVPVHSLQAWQLIRFIQMYASQEFGALYPDFVLSDEPVSRANTHARKLARFYAVPQLQDLMAQATGVTPSDFVMCLNSVPAAKVKSSTTDANAESHNPSQSSKSAPLLLTANGSNDPDFGSPKRGVLAQLLGAAASPAKMRTPRHYMGSADRDDDRAGSLSATDVMRYLGQEAPGSTSSTPPRSNPTSARQHSPARDITTNMTRGDDADGVATYVPPYPPVRNPSIDHAMLRAPGSSQGGRVRGVNDQRVPARHLPEVAERAVQDASRLTPKQEAALALYRWGGRAGRHDRPHYSDDGFGPSGALGLEKQLVGRSSQRQREIEAMIRREVQAGSAEAQAQERKRRHSPERQRPEFQLMGGNHSQVYFKAQRRLAKGAAKAKAALDWQAGTAEKQALRKQIEAERRQLQVMQARATSATDADGGRVGMAALDKAQVRAGLDGDIKAVINDVNRSVLGEVESMMLASGIRRTLDETEEAVSPILRSRSEDDEDSQYDNE
eukprot:INCI14288.2.p1 GENE.INCI14288.2~~INCI14288.2.p1  ORF type:complete len:1225 (-),score=192.32 INCI14288.2:22-3555(-)